MDTRTGRRGRGCEDRDGTMRTGRDTARVGGGGDGGVGWRRDLDAKVCVVRVCGW